MNWGDLRDTMERMGVADSTEVGLEVDVAGLSVSSGRAVTAVGKLSGVQNESTRRVVLRSSTRA